MWRYTAWFLGTFYYSFCTCFGWFLLFASRSILIHPLALLYGMSVFVVDIGGWLLFFTLIFALEVWDGIGKVLPGLFSCLFHILFGLSLVWTLLHSLLFRILLFFSLPHQSPICLLALLLTGCGRRWNDFSGCVG